MGKYHRKELSAKNLHNDYKQWVAVGKPERRKKLVPLHGNLELHIKKHVYSQ